MLNSIFQHWEELTNLERDRTGMKREYRLDRMEHLCALFAHPERSYKVIHLAGSKGKGSTAAMGAYILSQTQGPVGLYTSPHIQDYRERFTLLGSTADQETLLLTQARRIEEKRAAMEEGSLPGGNSPTTFELLTLLGFLYFQAAQCTWVLLETGLGGRLDATNVVNPEAAIITPIELEHQDFLGNTLEAIAAEKAGIIKKGKPLFSARQKPEVLEVLKKEAAGKKAELYYLPEYLKSAEIKIDKGKSDISLKWTKESAIASSHFSCFMMGDVQAYNAALILLCLHGLIPEIKQEDLHKGLEAARLPGRGQYLPGHPSLMIDGAHTPDSLASAVKSFSALGQHPRILLFGCAIDKDSRAMGEKLKGQFDKIYITRPGSFKTSDPAAVAETFKNLELPVILEPDTAEAYEKALEAAGKDGSLLISGSFFLAGEVLKLRGEN